MDPFSAAIGAISYQFSSSILAIIEYIIVLIIPRIRVYTVPKQNANNGERTPDYVSLMKRLATGKYLYTADRDPIGFVIGRWYIAHVTITDAKIYCSRATFDGIVEGVQLKSYITIGNFDKYSEYVIRYKKVQYKEIILSKSQKLAVNHIKKCMEHINVFWLFGPPGTGKTTVARYLAKDLNLPLVENFSLFNKKPYDIAIYTYDEVDGLLHSKLNPNSRDIGADKDPKNTWCTSIDRFQLQYGSILIFTSNTHPKDITGCTDAFWRPGRVALIEMTKRINTSKSLVRPVKF